jgi:predicted RND superfamily exporter protein
MTAGFGLEKLGLLSLRYPWLCLVGAALITPLLAYGASQLEFSSDVREIFRSGDPAFRQLELVGERFPGNQRDIQIVVASDKTFDLEELQALKALHQELETLDGVQAVLSMFSAVQAPEEGSEPEPLSAGYVTGKNLGRQKAGQRKHFRRRACWGKPQYSLLR